MANLVEKCLQFHDFTPAEKCALIDLFPAGRNELRCSLHIHVDNNSIYIDNLFMTRYRAPSASTKLTLFALQDVRKGLHGYEITRLTGVAPGTLYPMLIRLEEQGLLSADWEESPEPGRPPRHIYRLTSLGRARVRELMDDAGAEAEAQPALKRLKAQSNAR
jgi:PadR family transcriptional regulator, regulatory protein PadR